MKDEWSAIILCMLTGAVSHASLWNSFVSDAELENLSLGATSLGDIHVGDTVCFCKYVSGKKSLCGFGNTFSGFRLENVFVHPAIFPHFRLFLYWM